MSHCSSPTPEVPGFSIETGEQLVGGDDDCFSVNVHYSQSKGQIFVSPNRRRAPFPKSGRPAVKICWFLTHPALGWQNQAGIDMKGGWDPAWGTPVAVGNRYELVVSQGPANKVKYAYSLNLTVDGQGIPTIDPEVEYDDDF